jgi:hypothetical protein
VQPSNVATTKNQLFRQKPDPKENQVNQYFGKKNSISNSGATIFFMDKLLSYSFIILSLIRKANWQHEKSAKLIQFTYKNHNSN